jgi:FRG domain
MKSELASIKEIAIRSFSELIDYLGTNCTCGHHVYRGVSNKEYDLIPSVGRYAGYNFDDEEEMFKKFRRRSFSSLPVVPTSDWDWLAIAQHYGLPTRLLDWKSSALVAAFFATQPKINNNQLAECSSKSVAIYILHFCRYIDVKDVHEPLKYDRVGVLYPPHISPRIYGQQGLFTIQPNPNKPLTYVKDERFPNDIDKLVLDKECAAETQKQLFRLGVKEDMLFPDLDGFSRTIRMQQLLAESHYTEC